jgi:hypothetical protein
MSNYEVQVITETIEYIKANSEEEAIMWAEETSKANPAAINYIKAIQCLEVFEDEQKNPKKITLRDMYIAMEGELDSIFWFLHDLGISEDEIDDIAQFENHDELVSKYRCRDVKDN